MEELIAQFKKGAKKLSLALEQAKDILQSGIMLTDDEYADMDATFRTLKTVYDDIYRQAEEQCREEIPLPQGLSVDDYYKHVQKSAELRQERQKQKLFRDFTRVKAHLGLYQQALEDIQFQVRSVLDRINAPNRVSNAELDALCEKLSMFFEALSADDPASQEELITRLSTVYPPLVLGGLLAKQYYVENPEAPSEPDPDTESPPQSEPKPKSYPKPKPTFAPNLESKIEPQPQPGSVFTISPVKKLKVQAPSAASFKKGVVTYFEEVKCLLPILTNIGAFTPEQAMLFCNFIKNEGDENLTLEQVIRSLNQLTTKNIAAEYLLPDTKERVFCLTPFTLGSLKKKEVATQLRRFWDVSLGTFFYPAKDALPLDELQLLIRRNSNILRYLGWCLENLPFPMYRLIQGSLLRTESEDFLNLPDQTPCTLLFPKQLDGWNLQKPALCVFDCEPDRGRLPEDLSNLTFLLPDGLFRWEDGWKPCMNGHAEADPEDGPEPDAEVDPESEPKPDTEADEVPSTEEAVEEPASEPTFQLDPNPEPEPAPDQEPVPQTPPRNTRELAAALLERDPAVLEQSDCTALLVHALAEDKIMEAEVLTQAAAVACDTWARTAASQLAYAVNSPLETVEYSSGSISTLENQALDSPLPEIVTRGARLSALLWAYTFPAYAFDMDLFTNYKGQIAADAGALFSGHNQDDPSRGLKQCDELNRLFRLLTDSVFPLSHNFDGKCFSPMVLQCIRSDSEAQLKQNDLRVRADEVIRAPMPRGGYFTGYDELLADTIGLSSALGQCMYVIRDRQSNLRLLQEVFSQFKKDPKDTHFSQSRIEEYIDQSWRAIYSSNRGIRMKQPLIRRSAAWNQIQRGVVTRLELVSEWLSLSVFEQRAIPEKVVQDMKDAYAQVEKLVRSSADEVRTFVRDPGISLPQKASANLVISALSAIDARLTNGESARQPWRYISLLSSCHMKLDETGCPELDPGDNLVRGFEPWRRMTAHLAAEPVGPELALTYIQDESVGQSQWFGNYGVAQTLMQYLSDVRGILPVDLEKAKKGARLDCEKLRSRFESEFRLACAYGKIDEDMEETAFQTADGLGRRFLQQDDYGFYHRLLEHLTAIIPLETGTRKKNYSVRLDNAIRARAAENTPLATDIMTALEEENFALAEEYLIRLEEGETQRSDQEMHGDAAPDYHQRFLDCYDQYYSQCNRSNTRMSHPKNWAQRVMRELPTFWSTPNQEKTGYRLVDSWIGGKSISNTNVLIRDMLNNLGFSVSEVRLQTGQGRNEQFEVYRAACQPDLSGKRDYDHPIAKFGTAMGEFMNVVCLFGCKGVSTIINIMTRRLQLTGPTIVLLEGILSLTERRMLAANFKLLTSGQSSFLLIDRILLLYLAALDEGERKIALLKCTLPYTFEQPFTKGAGAVPDEMFFGRVRERNELCDKNGPHLVYGGRQLGKTALLLRCRSIQHRPADKYYAYHIDIKGKRSDQLLIELKKKLVEPGFVEKDCPGMEALCEQIEESYRQKRFVQLQIFLDEVDEFFAEAARNKYEMLRPFTRLMLDTSNQVKFVFAGLHNVAHTRTANDGNSPILYLGKPLCIAPLSPADARKLIERPLAYLGFSIGERELALILARTNHYPGLLHLFGYSLLQSVCSNYNEYYSPEKENPPYKVLDAQMKAVFAKEDLEKEINQRVDATINGLDDKYRMIANLLAYLYYQDEAAGTLNLYGYLPEEIRFIDVYSLRNLSEEDFQAILNEMVDMGILSYNQDHGTYRLRKRSFLTVVGKPRQVEDVILQDADRE